MKLLFAGFSLIIGFTIIACTSSLLIKFANSVVDGLIEKAEAKLKERKNQATKNK
jgi:hypothetical protein